MSKGGASKSKSGGAGPAEVVFKRERKLQSRKETLLTLRSALFDEHGHDRDMITPNFKPFLEYECNDVFWFSQQQPARSVSPHC